MNRSEIANKYNKRYTKTICVRLNVKTDRDILERLNQVGNKCGYIKQLIRNDCTDEWCDTCKEYDSEKHSCPRWNKVIRKTIQELKGGEQK